MKIAIFNGFNFHFEMFGYIIEYCLLKNFKLDIFTPFELDLGWLSFYQKFLIKDNKDITIKNVKEYPIKNDYDHIILTTDDDRFFPDMLINEKFICIDHYHKIRRFNVPYHITTRKFPSRKFGDWALPVYKITDISEKNSKSNVNCSSLIISIIAKYNIYFKIELSVWVISHRERAISDENFSSGGGETLPKHMKSSMRTKKTGRVKYCLM